MQNYAVIDGNGNVINVITWDGISPFVPPIGTKVIQTDTAGIGWTYNGSFIKPNT